MVSYPTYTKNLSRSLFLLACVYKSLIWLAFLEGKRLRRVAWAHFWNSKLYKNSKFRNLLEFETSLDFKLGQEKNWRKLKVVYFTKVFLHQSICQKRLRNHYPQLCNLKWKSWEYWFDTFFWAWDNSENILWD